MSTPQGRRRIPEAIPQSVATVYVYAGFAGDPEADEEYSGAIYRAAERARPLITAQIRESVSQHLGPEFDVDVTLRPAGSLELLATIVLGGSAVMTYGAVRQGLEYVRRDAKTALRLAVGHAPGPWPELAAHITLGPEMSKFKVDRAPDTSPGAPSMTYLAVVGTVVIATLLGLLLAVVLVQVL